MNNARHSRNIMHISPAVYEACLSPHSNEFELSILLELLMDNIDGVVEFVHARINIDETDITIVGNMVSMYYIEILRYNVARVEFSLL